MQEKLIVNLSQEETIQATVPDINYIPAYKVAEEQRRANELERIANENERIEYYEELQRDVENGEYDGKNTVYVGDAEPTDDFYNVWIDPEGMPEVSAENLVFADSETLQDKYDNGDLKGPKGDAGTNDYNDLKNKPIIPDKTSDLINDSNFATESYVDNEIATFDFIKVVDVLPETGLDNKLYFVPKTDTQTQDLFDEYTWINGNWEWITTKQLEVDLTPYYKKAETYSNSEVNNLMNNLQATILNNICPIGKIEVFFDDKDHSNHLGFTWERTSLGRSPIGYNPNSNDDRFKVIGNTFGDLEHEHGLSKGHAQMIDNGSNKLNFKYKYGVDYWEANNSVEITGVEQTSESLNYGIQLGGTTDSGSSLQPVEVMAFWKRTA